MSTENTELAPHGQLEPVKTVDLKGNPHPSADGLVDHAHRNCKDRNLVIINNEMKVLAFPTADNENTAIVWVKGFFENADDPTDEHVYTFEEIGDANPANCSRGVGDHFIRMASTRAMSRMLALALNVEGVISEELGEGGGSSGGSSSGGSSKGQHKNAEGKSYPDWMYKIPFGKNKDKRIDDPTVPIKDLRYFLDNGKLNKKNEETDKFDLPDEERIELWEAEIASREGGGSSTPAKGGMAAKATTTAAKGKSNWTPGSVGLQKLVKLGKASEPPMNYAQIKEMCAENFPETPDPAKLGKDDFDTLVVMLGGDPDS